MPLIDIVYFKAATPVHRMHPFAKIWLVLVVTFVAAFFNEPWVLATLIVLLAGLAAIARIPRRKFRYLWVVLSLLIFFVLVQAVWFTSFGDFGTTNRIDSHVLFHLWPSWLPGGPAIPFVQEGAIFGLSLGLRFMAIALAFPIFVITTHPSDLITALAEVRIGRWRVPYNFIFIFATAFRFVPTVSAQFDRTYDAQSARGVKFESRNPVRKFRTLSPLFVPVLISSMLQAQTLTLALETRAFGAVANRTFMHELRWRAADSVVVLLLLLLLIGAWFASQVLGLGLLPYTPGR